MASLFAGKRMIVLGGAGVAALAAMSVMMMNLGGGDESSAHADAAHASSARRAATPPPAAAEEATRPADTSPAVPGVSDEDVFQRREYTYRSLGRRDPFKNLVASELTANRFYGDQIDPELISLVGTLQKDGEHRGLIEDQRGFGYVLRKGDPVLHGRVTAVGPDYLKIRHSAFGIAETLTLTLNSKEQGGPPHGNLR